MRIVLASSSPSRRMILANAGVDPVIQPADVDEDALLASLTDASPADAVAALARAKAHAVAGQFHDDVVIGGDSMLLLDGHLQGKPHTPEATVERWHAQAGKVAQLLTGHCILHQGEEFVETSTTTVHFAAASDADIQAYAASGEPWQCAGAFTLEALGGWFIDTPSSCSYRTIVDVFALAAT